VLEVEATSGPPLSSSVQFHLHPTFARPVMVVEPTDGRATLTLSSYGAFTVGAVADEGRTMLELDLSTVEGFPAAFHDYR
jgi:prokaryotic YEATS domain